MRHVLGMDGSTGALDPEEATKAAHRTFEAASGMLPAPSAVTSWLACEHLSTLADKHARAGFQHVIFALGFERAPLPDLFLDGQPLQVPPGYHGYDYSSGAAGQLRGATAADDPGAAISLPHAYGCGLAFPHIDMSNDRKYEAASIPLFLSRAKAMAAALGLPGTP